MNINIVCPECSSGGFASLFVETIRDDGFYTGKCPAGHDVLVATQTLRHEMLFEIGLNAIRDKYFREAVSSFAASAKRFYEFAIRVFGKCDLVPEDVIEGSWKAIATQSERQFGAYVWLYVSHYKRLPTLLSRNMIELRNEVVHKGVLPSRDKSIAFGKNVYAVIQNGVRMLREKHLTEVNAILSKHVSSIAKQMGNQYPRTFMVTPTALNIIQYTTRPDKPFESFL